MSKFRFNFNSIQTLKSRLHGSLCRIRFGDLCVNMLSSRGLILPKRKDLKSLTKGKETSISVIV